MIYWGEYPENEKTEVEVNGRRRKMYVGRRRAPIMFCRVFLRLHLTGALFA